MSMTLIQYAAQFDLAVQGVVQALSEGMLFSGLPVQQIEGLTHKYGSCDYEGGIGTRKINDPFPASASSTVNPISERTTICGAQIKVDVRLASKGRAPEIARRTRALGRFADSQILNGAGLTDAEKIVGLKDRLTGDQKVTIADNGGALSLAKFEALIDAVDDQGAGRIVVMNKKNARKLKALIVASASGASLAEVSAGVMSYEGVTILIAGKDHDGAELLGFTETQGSSNACASMYCIAPGTGEDNTGVQLLMASNGVELIDEGTRDSQKVDTVEVAFGLGIFNKKAAARLCGITNA